MPLGQEPARDAAAPGEADHDVDAPPLDFPPRTPHRAPDGAAHLCWKQGPSRFGQNGAKQASPAPEDVRDGT